MIEDVCEFDVLLHDVVSELVITDFFDREGNCGEELRERSHHRADHAPRRPGRARAEHHAQHLGATSTFDEDGETLVATGQWLLFFFQGGVIGYPDGLLWLTSGRWTWRFGRRWGHARVPNRQLPGRVRPAGLSGFDLPPKACRAAEGRPSKYGGALLVAVSGGYVRPTVRLTRPPEGSVVPGGRSLSEHDPHLRRPNALHSSNRAARVDDLRLGRVSVMPTTLGTTHWFSGGGGGGGVPAPVSTA